MSKTGWPRAIWLGVLAGLLTGVAGAVTGYVVGGVIGLWLCSDSVSTTGIDKSQWLHFLATTLDVGYVHGVWTPLFPLYNAHSAGAVGALVGCLVATPLGALLFAQVSWLQPHESAQDILHSRLPRTVLGLYLGGVIGSLSLWAELNLLLRISPYPIGPAHWTAIFGPVLMLVGMCIGFGRLKSTRA